MGAIKTCTVASRLPFYNTLTSKSVRLHLSFGPVCSAPIWVAPLVQCYLFSGGALVFYVFLRGTISPFSRFFLFSTFFYVFLPVEEPIEQVPLHKWCPLNVLNVKT